MGKQTKPRTEKGWAIVDATGKLVIRCASMPLYWRSNPAKAEAIFVEDERVVRCTVTWSEEE